MRKILLALSVLTLLTFAVSTATAQEQIALDGALSGYNTLTFTSTGAPNSSGWTVTFPGGGLEGTATGQPGTPWFSALFPVSYYFIGGAGVTITGTNTSYMLFPGGNSAIWNVTQSAPLSFSICPTSTACGPSTALLTGTLELVNLSQTVFTGAPYSTGVFNGGFAANLTITGGSDASLITPNAQASITFDLPPTNLATLAKGSALTGTVSSGEILSTPEPVSMGLVGSGLVLLGFLIRRRRTAQ
jgi:hypothetical protein